MTPRGHLRNLAVALTGCGFALLALAVWIPLDVDTGVIDVWRRNVRIGDAMLPVFSAAGMALAGAVIGGRSLLEEQIRKAADPLVAYAQAGREHERGVIDPAQGFQPEHGLP